MPVPGCHCYTERDMREMPVRINIPPAANAETGYSCGEVALQAAVQYLLPEAEPLTRAKAEELTRKLPNHNTWPEELARITELYPALEATIYRTHPIEPSVSEYVRRFYGPENEHLLEETNVPSLEEAIGECTEKGVYKFGPFDLETIFDLITENQVVIGWFDCNVLYEYEINNFKAHYNILTGYDLDCVSMHESGNSHTLPVNHQRIGHERFMKALGPTPNLLVLRKA